MLELRGASASYGEVTAVRDLTLSVGSGESLALVGRNGAGKTTTLRLIAGEVEPSTGEVCWNGDNLAGQPPEKRVRRGIVLAPEGRGIFPGLTVEENLRMGAFWRRPRPAKVREELADIFEILPRLKERRTQPGGSLSGGEQQLLAIGRALLSHPQLLLLDEPSLGLSPLAVEMLYELLRSLKERKVGFILVEQYVPLALELCDRAVGLQKGDIAFTGKADEIAHDKLTEVYMGGDEFEESPSSNTLS